MLVVVTGIWCSWEAHPAAAEQPTIQARSGTLRIKPKQNVEFHALNPRIPEPIPLQEALADDSCLSYQYE
jgi:hypothetical protein